MEWKKLAHPCIGAAFALQVVEFSEAVHPCAPDAERVRCEALPGRHIHFPEAPAQGDMKLIEVTVTSSLSTGTLGSRVISSPSDAIGRLTVASVN
jgi:hypothetical protein